MKVDKSLSDLFTSELHNKTMVGMVDGVRTLKHDYNNIMQALNGYVATKQYDKLQEHINKVLEECNIINNLSIIDPKIFNHPAIYGIVGAKYFLATEENIIFDLDIVTNISEICFPIPELSRILGIFLDNAMEATKKCDNPYIRLEMKYDNRKCADIIKVINSYDTSINIDLSEIYKKGISSKKVKSGLGLWEVKNLVKKVNNSQVFATIENTKFVQNLIVEKI
jgi:two-component system sensor histidine kinase AgrC